MPDIYTTCMEDDIRRRENQRLFEQMNEAYAGPPDPEEIIQLAYMRKLYRRTLRNIKWNTDVDESDQKHDRSDPDSQ
jgi:hypothetical protein